MNSFIINCSAASALFYQSNHRSDVRSSAMIFQLEPTIGPKASKSQVSRFDPHSNTTYKQSNSIPAADQFTSVDRLLCTFFQTNQHQPNRWKGWLCSIPDSPWRAKPVPLDGSPFYSPRFSPVYLFYLPVSSENLVATISAISHKKKSLTALVSHPINFLTVGGKCHRRSSGSGDLFSHFDSLLLCEDLGLQCPHLRSWPHFHTPHSNGHAHEIKNRSWWHCEPWSQK